MKTQGADLREADPFVKMRVNLGIKLCFTIELFLEGCSCSLEG